MEGPWGHYAKWDKIEEKKTVWSHLYIKSKKAPNSYKYREQIGGCRGDGWGVGKIEEGSQ